MSEVKIHRLHHITQLIGDDVNSHLVTIENALLGGAKMIQLRVKNTDNQTIIDLAKKAKTMCASANAKLVINDHVDICEALDLDGVHLGLTDMSTLEARSALGKNKIIGGTANTLEDVLYHYKNGVDYVGVGPFRFTTTKDKLSPVLGIEGYQHLMRTLDEREVRLPVIAIGGIQLDDIQPILNTGVHGVALASLINLDSEPIDKTKQVIAHLGNC